MTNAFAEPFALLQVAPVMLDIDTDGPAILVIIVDAVVVQPLHVTVTVYVPAGKFVAVCEVCTGIALH